MAKVIKAKVIKVRTKLPTKHGILAAIPRQSVNSSTLRTIGYSEKWQCIVVEFWSRGIGATKNTPKWGYCPFSQEDFDNLVKAESIGHHFHVHIKMKAMDAKKF